LMLKRANGLNRHPLRRYPEYYPFSLGKSDPPMFQARAGRQSEPIQSTSLVWRAPNAWVRPSEQFSGYVPQFLARAMRCTPSAWMMLSAVLNRVPNAVSNRVLRVGHFWRAQMGKFS
jgi:hypothetical protein